MHSPLVSVICVDAWDFEIGTDRAEQANEAKILHKNGVDAGFGEPHDMLLDGFELRREDERVERDVTADVALVEVRHDFWECIKMQIGGPGAGIKSAFETEVDSVCAVFDGGGYAQPIARRRKQLPRAVLAERGFRRMFVAAIGW